MKHAAIIPLIGGSAIASTKVFKTKPEYAASYPGFENHDNHLVEHLDIPYHKIGEVDLPRVDVVSTICPCAGLSSMADARIDPDNANNDWMLKSAEYTLGTLKPKVFWGENAPQLTSPAGRGVFEYLRAMADHHGYSFSTYRTSCIKHGLPQNRRRSFYFFWKGEPGVIPFVDRDFKKDTLQLIREAPKCEHLVKRTKPTDDPWYAYLLEEVYKTSHQDFASSIDKTVVVQQHLIKELDVSMRTVAKWFKKQGDRFPERKQEQAIRAAEKIEAGLGIRYKCPRIPHRITNAIVGDNLEYMAHPDEDRFISTKEALALMGMPRRFNVERKNFNMVAQNVPVPVAEDMARAVKKYVEGNLKTVSSGRALFQDNLKQENSRV